MDFADFVFVREYEVNIRFETRQAYVSTLTPDHVVYFKVTIPYTMFFEYDVTSEEAKQWYSLHYRSFMSVLRKHKKGEILSLIDKEGKLFLGPPGKEENWVGEALKTPPEELDLSEAFRKKNCAEFFNPAVLMNVFKLWSVGSEYFENMTLWWENNSLTLVIGGEKCKIKYPLESGLVNVTEYSGDAKTTIGLGAIDHLPTAYYELCSQAVDEGIVMFRSKEAKYGASINIIIAPKSDVFLEPPRYETVALFDDVDRLKYIMLLLGQYDADRGGTSVLKMTHNLITMESINAPRTAFLSIRYAPPHAYFAETFHVSFDDRYFNTEAMVKIIDLLDKFGSKYINMAVDDFFVYICGCIVGKRLKAEEAKEIEEALKLGRDLIRDSQEELRREERALMETYAHLIANLMKGLVEKRKRGFEKAYLLADSVRNLWIFQIIDTKLEYGDMIRAVSYDFHVASVNVADIPIVPLPSLLRHIIITMTFKIDRPAYFTYDYGYYHVDAVLASDFEDAYKWAEENDYLRPLTKDFLIKLLTEFPGLTKEEIEKRLLKLRISPRELESVLKTIPITVKNDRIYLARPTTEEERIKEDYEMIRSSAEKYASRLSSVREKMKELRETLKPFGEEAEKLEREADEAVEKSDPVKASEALSKIKDFLSRYDKKFVEERIGDRYGAYANEIRFVEADAQSLEIRFERLREYASRQGVGLSTPIELSNLKGEIQLAKLDEKFVADIMNNVMKLKEKIPKLEELSKKAPPAPPPKPPEKPSVAPEKLPKSLQEAEPFRREIEKTIYERVKPPRPEITRPVIRIDWHDAEYSWLGARISYHRDAEEMLKRAVEEIGGVIERIAEARPPMKVMYVDFRGSTEKIKIAPPAPPPPPPPAPPPTKIEEEAEKRWRAFEKEIRETVERWIVLYVPKAKQEWFRNELNKELETIKPMIIEYAKTGKEALISLERENTLKRFARDVTAVSRKALEDPLIKELLEIEKAPKRPRRAPEELLPPPEEIAFAPWWAKPRGVGWETWKFARWLGKLERMTMTRGPGFMGIPPRLPGVSNPWIAEFPPMVDVKDDIIELHPTTLAGLEKLVRTAGLNIPVKTTWRKDEILDLLKQLYPRASPNAREWIDILRREIEGEL